MSWPLLSTPQARDPAPVGLVTLVFTDVQGSTLLWDRHTEAMRGALIQHNHAIRSVLDASGGYEVKTEGDAFMVAFATPFQAVWFCLKAQLKLVGLPWPDELLDHACAAALSDDEGQEIFRGLRVRMGIHMGAPDCRPDPRTGRMDYLGPVTNRAARIAQAGHGGQVLLSEAVWREVRRQTPRLNDPAVKELGEFRLRDIDTPEKLTQLLPRNLVGRKFPRLRTTSEISRPLPLPSDRFLGRSGELNDLERRLTAGERLLTLVGSGGVGKTRLAIELASHIARDDAFSGGVHFCDLTEARTVYGACHIVGTALGVPLDEGNARDTVAQVGRGVAGRGDALFVLDNLEQMSSIAAETLQVWLELAPRARFLVTSRERLRLRGESVVEVGPLKAPENDDEDTVAVELFLDRAQRARPGLELKPRELRAVREIVRQLDGIPLALELAAARMRVLTPRGLLDRLPARLELLKDGQRGGHQRTMREALDWSWQLLTPEEQGALAQCAVFHAGFSLEIAEEVIDPAVLEADYAPAVLDVIEALRDKSLLRADDDGDGLRFSLFQTIREYARQKLDDDAHAITLERHGLAFERLAKRCLKDADGPRGVECLRALYREGENLVAALMHALEHKKVARAHTILVALEPLFLTRGPLGVFIDLCDEVLAVRDRDLDVDVRARAYLVRGRARHARGDMAEAHADMKRALRRARQAKLRETEGRVLTELGALNHDLGRDEAANGFYQSAVATLKRAEAPLLEGRAQRNLGVLYRQRGKKGLAGEHLQNALDAHEKTGDARMEAATLAELAALAHALGDLDKAHKQYQRALELNRFAGDRRAESVVLSNLGALYQEQGRLPHAEHCYRSATEICRAVGDRRALGVTLGLMGGLLFERFEIESAREHFREAAQLAREVKHRRGEGSVLARWGAADATLDDFESAEEHFDAAELLLEGLRDVHLLEALTLLRGHLDLAEARVLEKQSANEGAERCRKSASRRVAEVMVGQPGRARALEQTVIISGNAIALMDPGAPTATQTLAIQSDEVRFALRTLEAALELSERRASDPS